MNKKIYSNLGYTPREDGTFYVYELDWNEVHKWLAPRCELRKSKSLVRGPFRVRIAKKRS